MRVKKLKACPHCGEIVDKEESPLEDRFQCGECEEIFEDREEAVECCKE